MNGRLLTPGVVIAGLEACWLYALLHLLHAKIGAAAPGAGTGTAVKGNAV